MDGKQLYEAVLGLCKPWRVVDVCVDHKGLEVVVKVGHREGQTFQCPECARKLGVYDHLNRRWRHLDTCQFKTYLEADVPRVSCPEHGVHQVEVPWAEPRGRFTAMFEAYVIWFVQLSPSLSKAAEWFGISWDEVDGIVGRAVKRGRERKAVKPVKHMAVDETSFAKGQEYVVVVSNQDTGTVEEVLEDRTQQTMEKYYDERPKGHLKRIKSVSMDMWMAFISATKAKVPEAERKICFDRFHVSGHLCKGVDEVRRKERKELAEAGWKGLLEGTKYEWLRNAALVDNRARRWFMEISRCELKTARAWAMKEMAGHMWDYASEGWARRQWKRLIYRLLRSKLEPMEKVGRMIRNHLEGILNAIRLRVSNGQAESLNAGIQRIKNLACGYRNKGRFIRMILFVKGGLELYPAGVATPWKGAHTEA